MQNNAALAHFYLCYKMPDNTASTEKLFITSMIQTLENKYVSN